MSDRERQKQLAKPTPVHLTGSTGYTPQQVLEYFEAHYLEPGQPNDGYRPTIAGNSLTLWRRQTKASQGMGIAGPIGLAVGGMMKTSDGVVITVTTTPSGGTTWVVEGNATARLAQRLGVLGAELAKVPPPAPQQDNEPAANEERIPCPRCREMILPKATICRFCGSELPAGQT